jgi:hypothetical protein
VGRVTTIQYLMLILEELNMGPIFESPKASIVKLGES